MKVAFKKNLLCLGEKHFVEYELLKWRERENNSLVWTDHLYLSFKKIALNPNKIL